MGHDESTGNTEDLMADLTGQLQLERQERQRLQAALRDLARRARLYKLGLDSTGLAAARLQRLADDALAALADAQPTEAGDQE